MKSVGGQAQPHWNVFRVVSHLPKPQVGAAGVRLGGEKLRPQEQGLVAKQLRAKAEIQNPFAPIAERNYLFVRCDTFAQLRSKLLEFFGRNIVLLNGLLEKCFGILFDVRRGWLQRSASDKNLIAQNLLL